jgi:hypothetical protein
MMHHNSITIALTNDDKTPYREYSFKKLHDKCKTCEVILPFDSHYQLLIKNDNSSRIRLDIDIDGTVITGTGLIIPSNSHHYVERFIETAKKLYFTKKTNEKVADPTNKENGFLTIKVAKEKVVPYKIYEAPAIWIYPYLPYQQDMWHYHSNKPYWDTGTGIVYGSTSGDSILRGLNVSESSISCFNACSSSKLDTGATVEGDASKQSFTTTNWAGEEVGSDFIFQFKMLGQEVKMSPQEEKDLMEYKRLKAKFEGK